MAIQGVLRFTVSKDTAVYLRKQITDYELLLRLVLIKKVIV